jgi:aspartate racemase
MWEFACNDCDRFILAYTELSVLQEYREMPEITLDLPKRDRFILVGCIW